MGSMTPAPDEVGGPGRTGYAVDAHPDAHHIGGAVIGGEPGNGEGPDHRGVGSRPSTP